MKQFDYIVIGGGVVGAMIARWLSRYEGSLLLIEKEGDAHGHEKHQNQCRQRQ